MSNFIDNFIGGFTFGMLANSPFFGGCFGYPMMYNRVDFGGFANPFPSVFGNMGYSSMVAQPMPTTFANSSFPSINFTEAGEYIWDTYANPDSEYNKRMREMYKEYENRMKDSNSSGFQQNWFSMFNMPGMTLPWFGEQKKADKTGKTEKSDEPDSSTKITNRYDDKRFNKFLSIILGREGGYSNSKVDRGGETYKGITHTTYDEYRKSKGLSTQSVTKMTDDEMQEIYYERFYKASGADIVTDKKLALYVFDTAVNMGVGVAKEFLEECGGDRDKFEQLRKNRYKKIIENDKDQKVHEKGWNNRMVAIKDAADNQLNAIA